MSQEETLVRLGLYKVTVNRFGEERRELKGYLTSSGKFMPNYFSPFKDSRVEGERGLVSRIVKSLNTDSSISLFARETQRYPYDVEVETFEGKNIREGHLIQLDIFPTSEVIGVYRLDRIAKNLPYTSKKKVE